MKPPPCTATGPAVCQAGPQGVAPRPRVGSFGRCALAALPAVLAAALLVSFASDAAAGDGSPIGPSEVGLPLAAGPWATESSAALAASELAPPRMAGLAGTPVVLGVSVERPRGLDTGVWAGIGPAAAQRPVVWTAACAGRSRRRPR